MPLKISIEQLCRDYYDLQIFEANNSLEIRLYAELMKLDQSLRVTNSNLFLCELAALNIELFGLAWFEHNYQMVLSKGQRQDQYGAAICKEITFTKSYLKQTGNDNVWSAAGYYNDTIYQVSIAQQISTDWSVFKDTGYFEKDDYLGSIDKAIEKSIRDDMEKLHTDEECAKRLANRLLSVSSWQEGILIPQKLSSTFAQRNNFSPNIEALFLLQRLTVGLYKNAKDYINEVISCGSWELARKASDEFIQHLKKFAQKPMERGI